MSPMNPSERQFMSSFGDVFVKWGLSKHAGQIYACLYLSEQPMHSEELSECLAIARSTFSSALKEVTGAGFVSPTHIVGERKEYYEAVREPWDFVKAVFDYRRRTTLIPARDSIKRILSTDAQHQTKHFKERVKAFLDTLNVMDIFYAEVISTESALLRDRFLLASEEIGAALQEGRLRVRKGR